MRRVQADCREHTPSAVWRGLIWWSIQPCACRGVSHKRHGGIEWEEGLPGSRACIYSPRCCRRSVIVLCRVLLILQVTPQSQTYQHRINTMSDSVPNYFLPVEVQNKMAMGTTTTTTHTCQISMLWNWYTIDSCFLARSWHVTSRGMFAGTCIGVFFWVMAYCWFHRFIVEYDNAIVEYKQKKFKIDACESCCGNGGCEEVTSSEEKGSSDEEETNKLPGADVKRPGSDFWTPLKNTFSHKWYLAWMKKEKNVIYPTPVEHIGRSGLYLMEWTVSYLIMLMWMYYNGYLIITMILGYFFGQLFFNYTPLTIVPRKDYTTPSCS